MSLLPNRVERALLLAAVLMLSACSTSPTGRSQLNLVSDEQMAEMGGQAFAEMKREQPVSDDPDLNRYVNCVASALTEQLAGLELAGEESREWDWEVAVFEDEAVNAFALPGGRIGVFTGLLDVAETRDQLAAVVGHEIAHVVARHGNARFSANFATAAGLQVAEAIIAGQAGAGSQRQLMAVLGLGAQYGVLMPYGRSQEREADTLGLRVMAAAGFRPQAAVALWHNMDEAAGDSPPEFLSTHPSTASRIEELQGQMNEAEQRFRDARDAGRVPECE